MRNAIRISVQSLALATGVVATALLVSLLGRDLLGVRAPHFFFATAVVAATFAGGFATGLYAAVLGTLCYTYFVLPPLYSLQVTSWNDGLVVILFLVEGACLAGLTQALGVTQRMAINRSPIRFAVVALALALAVLLKRALHPDSPAESPYVLFYAAVMASAWGGGAGAGLLTTGIAAGLAAFFFHRPVFSFTIKDPQEILRLFIFVLEGSAITFFSTKAYAARRAAVRAAKEKQHAEDALRASHDRLQRQSLTLIELSRLRLPLVADRDKAVQPMTAAAAHTLQCARVGVWLFDPERTRLVCIDLYEHAQGRHSHGAELLASRYPCYFHALEENRSLAADDARHDPRTAEFRADYLEPLGIVSMLDAPIRSGGVLMGVVCHEHIGTQPRHWAVEEEQFASSLADLVGLALETCQRQMAEEHIHEQASYLLQAREAILVEDLDGRIIYSNQGVEQLYGWNLDEIHGQQAAALGLVPQEPLAQQLRAALAEERSWQAEWTQRTRSGRELIIDSHWSMVRSADGKPRGALIINSDITEKKRLEERLQQAQRLQSIGALAGGIVHDLHNMLTPILAGIDLLRMPGPEADRQDLARTLKEAAERGASLLKQLLAFARGGSGQSGPVVVAVVLAELERLLARTFPHGIDVRMVVSPETGRVWGNATQIHQVVMNFCVNARDAMPKGGTLTLTTERVAIAAGDARLEGSRPSGRYVLIHVADTGTGIPPEVLAQLFDPFFSTKDAGQGTGLGLTTSLSIARSLGGTILVQSEVGRGSRFTLLLPAMPAEEIASTPESLSGETRALAILVIESDANLRELARRTLEAHGYRVLAVSDGREAVALGELPMLSVRAVIQDATSVDALASALVKQLLRLRPHIRLIVSRAESRHGQEPAAVPGEAVLLPRPYTAPLLLRVVRQVLESRAEG